MRLNRAGLTLLEVLLAGVILIVILGIITQGIRGGSSVVSTVVTESDLIEDTRVAGQMIADRVSSAVYIYPPGASLTLGSNTARTTRNPHSDTGGWRVGSGEADDPILAYIEAPQNGSESLGECLVANSKGELEVKNRNCYTFVAFYPVERDTYLKGGAYDEILGDPLNGDAWVLMEYRSVIKRTDPFSATDSALLTDISGRSAKMLADFILPGTGFQFVAGSLSCHARDSSVSSAENCTHIAASGGDLELADTLSALQFDLQARYITARDERRTPPMTFTASLRNPAYLNRD